MSEQRVHRLTVRGRFAGLSDEARFGYSHLKAIPFEVSAVWQR